MPSILKVGLLNTGPYACFESEVGPELMADSVRLAGEIRRLQQIAFMCVLEEKERLARGGELVRPRDERPRREPGEDRQEPQHATAGSNGVDHGRNRDGSRYEPPGPPAARAGGDRGRDRDGGGRGRGNNIPTTGNALVAWVKGFDERIANPWLMKALGAWAKRVDLPSMFNEWDALAVADGYSEAQRLIEEQQRPRGSRFD